MKSKLLVFYTILYVLIALFTLNFNYIEGDDAYTILYHAMGRQHEFQPHYSDYHSMFDAFMSLFSTTNETTLRYIAIGSSFLFGYLSLLSLALLCIKKGVSENKTIGLVLFLLPFLIPDILFNSLIVNATMFSFTFILLSHIFFLRFIENSRTNQLIIAVLLFGLGVSFRWINGFYLFVLFGDFILSDSSKLKYLISIKRLKRSFVIFPLFIISVIVFIQISGFSLVDIYNIYKSGTAYAENLEVSMLVLGASALALFTPALMLLFLLGIYYCITQKKYRNLLWFLIAILPYGLIGFFPSYKLIINVVPVLLFIVIQGASLLEKTYLKAGIIALALIPWLFGVQIRTSSAWGPDFEVKPKNIGLKDSASFSPDKRISLQNMTLVLGSGTAMPTPEGPRPVYGFGQVMTHKWHKFVDDINTQRSNAVAFAVQNKTPILQEVNHSFTVSKMVELGYKTEHPHNRLVDGKIEREFVKANSSVTYNAFKDKSQLFNKALMEDYLSKHKKVVVYSSYSNIITKLKTQYKEKFEPKGAFWGVLTY